MNIVRTKNIMNIMKTKKIRNKTRTKEDHEHAKCVKKSQICKRPKRLKTQQGARKSQTWWGPRTPTPILRNNKVQQDYKYEEKQRNV